MIEERKRKNKSVFRAVVYGSGGVRVQKSFPNRTLAKEWERRAMHERQEREASGVVVQDATLFSAFAARWLHEKVRVRCSNSTRVSYERVVRIHLAPIFAKLKLRDVRVDHANRLVLELSEKGYAPKGINLIVGVLLTMMNDATNWQVIARNPLHRFRAVKEPEAVFDFWSRAEIDHFLVKAATDPLYDLYVFALNTGMRRGEICGLKWDRVDFINGQIIVSRTLDRFGLNETTKSGKKRIVPMNKVVRAMLESRHRASRGGFVFTEHNGSPVHAHHLYRTFNYSQRAAGFTKTIRFHDLRHTFASHFMMNGGSNYDLQKILGHATQEMTQRYAHLSPGHLANAIQVVSFAGPSSDVVNIEEARRAKISGVSGRS